MLGDADMSMNYDITLVAGHLSVSQGTADATMTAQDVGGVYNAKPYTLPKPVSASTLRVGVNVVKLPSAL